MFSQRRMGQERTVEACRSAPFASFIDALALTSEAESVSAACDVNPCLAISDPCTASVTAERHRAFVLRFSLHAPVATTWAARGEDDIRRRHENTKELGGVVTERRYHALLVLHVLQDGHECPDHLRLRVSGRVLGNCGLEQAQRALRVVVLSPRDLARGP